MCIRKVDPPEVEGKAINNIRKKKSLVFYCRSLEFKFDTTNIKTK
jgi:hypothetical protein